MTLINDFFNSLLTNNSLFKGLIKTIVVRFNLSKSKWSRNG